MREKKGYDKAGRLCGAGVGTEVLTIFCGIAAATAFLLAGFFFPGFAMEVRAEEKYVNPQTEYEVILEDQADLLSEEEESALLTQMKAITTYGHAAFLTTAVNNRSAGSYAADRFYQYFGSESGVLFLIDMDNREIYIYSDGRVYRTITKSYANTITDNVYTYASDAEYYTCARKAFEQILTLLSGNRIAQPMKYVSNAFLALLIALLINYFVVMLTSKVKNPEKQELLKATKHRCSFTNTEVIHSHTTKKYDPPSSSSSGGGGGHGGGGGGHSGGGGGHRF